MCYYLRRRIYEIRIEGSLTEWPRTKWFFEREMEWMKQRCRAQMSWDNYGRDGWHIDHLIPMSWFDLRKLAHRKLCQRLANLRPAWGLP